MKVIILGPVLSKNSNGGVATFDEDLYFGFKNIGCNCNIVSLTKSDKIDNIVIGNGKKSKPFSFRKFRKLANCLKSIKPDLVISSLQYSIGIKIYKRKCPSAKFVQILHGSVCPTNGRIKSFLVNFVARYSRKHFDYVSCVSHLSAAINKKVFGIACDAVIYNGTSLPVPTKNELETKKEYDFIYVGRLYRDKNIELIMDSLCLLHEKYNNIKIAIIGFGELEHLFTTGKYKLDFVDFVGKVSHDQVKDYLHKSKFFISMNILEPCSIAIIEAAISGCSLIIPHTNGNNPLFYGKSFFHPVTFTGSEDLFNDIDKIFSKYQSPSYEELVSFQENVNWNKIAQKYLDLLNR